MQQATLNSGPILCLLRRHRYPLVGNEGGGGRGRGGGEVLPVISLKGTIKGGHDRTNNPSSLVSLSVVVTTTRE